MSILGIELDGSVLRWVEVHGTKDAFVVGGIGRVKLSSTRDQVAVKQFGEALQKVFAEVEPEKIAIREKVEGKGRMAAGPASSKMEAVVMLLAPTAVEFIGIKQMNKVDACDPKLKSGSSEELALRAAVAVI